MVSGGTKTVKIQIKIFVCRTYFQIWDLGSAEVGFWDEIVGFFHKWIKIVYKKFKMQCYDAPSNPAPNPPNHFFRISQNLIKNEEEKILILVTCFLYRYRVWGGWPFE